LLSLLPPWGAFASRFAFFSFSVNEMAAGKTPVATFILGTCSKGLPIYNGSPVQEHASTPTNPTVCASDF
jgi:hypothetical protein